jgi:hypothetical protein
VKCAGEHAKIEQRRRNLVVAGAAIHKHRSSKRMQATHGAVHCSKPVSHELRRRFVKQEAKRWTTCQPDARPCIFEACQPARNRRETVDPRRRLGTAMIPDALARWHRIVAARDTRDLEGLLSDDVVFHSPVVHTPQRGKTITVKYLAAALQVFGNETFRYVREIAGTHDAVLEFQVEIDGLSVNGVDMIRWDDSGRVVDFKVMLRPLKAVNLIHQKMSALLVGGG